MKRASLSPSLAQPSSLLSLQQGEQRLAVDECKQDWRENRYFHSTDEEREVCRMADNEYHQNWRDNRRLHSTDESARCALFVGAEIVPVVAPVLVVLVVRQPAHLALLVLGAVKVPVVAPVLFAFVDRQPVSGQAKGIISSLSMLHEPASARPWLCSSCDIARVSDARHGCVGGCRRGGVSLRG